MSTDQPAAAPVADNSVLYKALSVVKSIYYTDDFQVRLCWWCVYALIILYGCIVVAWRIYGQEISQMYAVPGKSFLI